MLEDRPSFVMTIEYNNGIVDLDDTTVVRIDDDFKSCNIILKKGGKKSMLKPVVKALEGFEKQFDELNEMKTNLEAEKEVARQEALAEVDKRFEVKSERIDRVLETVSETVEVEVPDEEVEETVEVEEEVPTEEVKDAGISF